MGQEELKNAFIENKITCWWKSSTDTTYFKYEQCEDKGLFQLEYITKNGEKYIYSLDTKKNKRNSYSVNGENKEFKFIDYVFFEINSKKYSVYKYVSDYNSIDGCISHFWTPEFGVFLIKSTSWCSYKKLLVNDKKQYKEVESLTEMLILNYKFYYGCLEKFDLRKYDEDEE